MRGWLGAKIERKGVERLGHDAGRLELDLVDSLAEDDAEGEEARADDVQREEARADTWTLRRGCAPASSARRTCSTIRKFRLTILAKPLTATIRHSAREPTPVHLRGLQNPPAVAAFAAS